MNKPRTIEGRWWIHGSDKPAHFGILSYDPETGLNLSVKIPQSRTDDEAWHEIFKGFPARPQVPQLVYGTDEHNKPVTLFGCGCAEWSITSGLDTYRIRSIAAILNNKATSWEDARFPVACVHYSLLSQWLNRHPRPQVEAGLLCFKVEAQMLVETELASDVHLKIEEIVLPQGSGMESRIEMSHRAWFFFPVHISAKSVLANYASVLLRGLSLLTGERVFIDDVSLHSCDPFKPSQDEHLETCELLIGNSGVTEARRDAHIPNMVAPFEEIRAYAKDVLKRWFECHERLEPVVDLYFAATSNPALSIQSRFLFLAQALEVYHARSTQFSSTESPIETHKARLRTVVQSVPTEYQPWVREKLSHSNQKTLAERISEVLSQHPNEAKLLATGISDFPTKVRHGRNYYTHYGQELYDSGKVPEGRELIRVTYALDGLLRICLLKELGVRGEPINRILKSSSSLELFDLESGAETGSTPPPPALP